ncbi:MAG: nickel pincer cofactor biosynthesis protein LarB [Planctomycetota bacterium]|nr:nickel pincer cofactor biosynthesis protein LarB [Planctomycetota bacterium]
MNSLKEILLSFKSDKMSVEETVEAICAASIAPLADACVDLQRIHRKGFSEVIFCERKTPRQVAEIAATLVKANGILLAPRADNSHYAEVSKKLPQAQYHERCRCITYGYERVEKTGLVVVVCAGTSDLPVAEEAKITAEMTGSNVDLIADVGVAGLHRIVPHLDTLMKARAIVVVAGMEGALPSLIAGLVRVPVVAVPTSVGYGASFGGLAPLLTMLNSCSPGIAVVNIDNGFGAGFFASLVNRGQNYGRSDKTTKTPRKKKGRP